jgi:ATP/maltotriose-dependent transcriptional regulator MalT
MNLNDNYMLETKISPPVPWGTNLLERQRLIELYQQNHDKKLVLLTASAGYGKSTLMSQWHQYLQQQNINSAWLTLDDDDNDPGRLFYYLHHLLNKNSNEYHPLKDLRKVTNWHAGILSNLLSNKGAPSVLFIDEFEVITNPESMRLLSMLQQRIPQGKQLVIASRTKPDWGLTKLKLNNDIFELSDLELKFSTTEATQLGELKLSGSFNESIAIKLIEKTEGWIAGIRLAMLCFPRIEDAHDWVENITGEVDEITNFLAEEVFRHLGTEQQLFLLKIAILDRCNDSLCEALTGEPGAQTQLESFCEKGLFMQPLDMQRHWFRLHKLFRQFLLKKLKQLIPQKVAKLHHQAAVWFNEKNYQLEAIHHAIAASNPVLAANILEQSSQDLVNQGQLTTLTALAAQISKLHTIETPMLLTSLCWSHIFLHEMDAAQERLQQLREIVNTKNCSKQFISTLTTLECLFLVIKDEIPRATELAEQQLPNLCEKSHFERGVLANIISYAKMCFNQIEVAHQYQLKARAAHLKSGSCFGLAYADMMGSMQAKLQGKLLQAKERFYDIGLGEDYRRYDDPQAACEVAKSVTNGFEVELLYELNLLDQAQVLLDKYFSNAANNTAPDMVIAAYITQARIAFVTGHFHQAYGFLEDGEVAALSWPMPRMLRDVRWERVRFALCKGEIDSAKVFAEKTNIDGTFVSPDGYLNAAEHTNAPDINALRLAIYTDDISNAISQLTILIDLAKNRPCRLLILLNLNALAHYKTGQHDQGLAILAGAIDLAAEMGAVRSIIDEGSELIKMLSTLHQQWLDNPKVANKKRKDYCYLLLEASGVNVRTDPKIQVINDELSERELEIITLVGEGLKNDQIAEKIFLSVNTVKWHLRRAYEKLGVRSRTEALAEGRRLGLIE